MAKRRSRRPKKNPIEQVLNDMLGEVQLNVAASLRQILMPPTPMFQPVTEPLGHTEAEPLPPPLRIKDAEVISIRKG